MNCVGKAGLTAIIAALKQLQFSGERGASKIVVSGTCNENVSIKNTDRLTLMTSTGAATRGQYNEQEFSSWMPAR